MTEKSNKPPSRLYKYRHFDGRSLDCVVDDQLFFADPSTFNDPLDSNPTLDGDLPNNELEAMLRELVERRVKGEMEAAATALRAQGPSTTERIVRRAQREAARQIDYIRYLSTDADFQGPDAVQTLLVANVERELLRRYERGIVSFAERPNCPLMWSHYGDQHRGVCFGYSVPADVRIEKVRYGGSRNVKASLIAEMLSGDEVAGRRLDAAVLLKKAWDWRYEREWRLIGDRGLRDSTLELEEVLFGLRCPDAVQFAIYRALAERRPPVKFYELRQGRGTFLLRKVRADFGEMTARWPRRARSLVEAFEDLTESD